MEINLSMQLIYTKKLLVNNRKKIMLLLKSLTAVGNNLLLKEVFKPPSSHQRRSTVRLEKKKKVWLFTFQFQQSRVCKPPTSLQKPPRQSFPQHSAASQDPPGLRWCKTGGHHPVCCNAWYKKKSYCKTDWVVLFKKRKEKKYRGIINHLRSASGM